MPTLSEKTYGYPAWMPWLFVVLCLCFVGSIIAAFFTGEWRLLAGALLSWCILAYWS